MPKYLDDTGLQTYNTHIKNVINKSIANGLPYITTAPTEDNSNGKLIVVVLSSEPATKYNGYLYIITE